MSTEWFTAKDIAGLPEFPGTQQNTKRKLEKIGARSRRRQQRGGGLEYHIASLPPSTRSALRARLVDSHADDGAIPEVLASDAERDARRQQQREAAMARFTALPAEKKARARAREWLLHESARYIEDNRYHKLDGLEHFCADLTAGLIAIPDRYKPYINHLHGRPHVAPSTLRDWDRKYSDQGIGGLVDSYGTRRGRSKIETTPELKRIVLGALFKQPHITAKKIHQYIQAEHPELDLVSVKSIDRYISTFKAENAQLWAYATNPDQWKNTFQPAFGSHHDHIERLNQLWELDSTPGDWMLSDGRHSVVGVIDLYSRRLKLHVSKTSTAAAVCQVFRSALLDWGVPEAIRTDNGKDYVSEQFTTVVRDLRIQQYLCIPFASEEKGTVERALQTMSHGILDLLPGFIGHNVAERKVIEARKSFSQRIMQPGEVVEIGISSAELQERLDQWTDHIYMHDEHGGLGGKTPWQVATSWTQPIRRIGNERALDMLLAEIAGPRTVSKKGIQLDYHYYIAPELLVGTEVRVRRDEADLGRIHVYSLTGDYICIAQCPQLLGFSPIELANAAKARTKKLMAAQRDELKDAKRAIKKDIATTIIQHRIAQSKNITALPQRSTDYSTPALDAAAQAADARDGRNSAPDISDSQRRLHADIERELTQPAPVIELIDTAEKRYARAYWLERKQHMNDHERDWLTVYQRGNEYKTQKMICEDFGIEPERINAGTGAEK